MKPPPLRVRLTGWYLVVIFASLAVYSVAMYFGLRSAIEDTVDHELQVRSDNIEAFLQAGEHSTIGNASTPGPIPAAPRLLPAPSAGEPRDDLYQIADSGGSILYQSPAMHDLRIPLDPTQRRDHYRHHRDNGNFTTYYHKGGDVRVLSSDVRMDSGDYKVQVATVVSPLYEVLELFQKWALAGLPLTLCLAALGGYWLSGRALRPVHNLVLATRAISERNLSRRLQLPAAQDELHELASTMNAMLGRLESAFTRITRFTSDASHELRTPIAVIRTTSEVMLEQDRSPEEYKDMVRQILLEAESASSLIEQLLTLARADADTAQLSFKPVDLRELVQDLDSIGKTLAEKSGLRWFSEAAMEETVVLGDRTHLRRLLLILIENACRYTESGGAVRLRLDSDAQEVRVEVIDTGIGIPPEDLPLIFERFYRASNARYLAPEGTGLGLSIAQWIAKAHEGTLTAQSAAGSGTCMRLRLKKA